MRKFIMHEMGIALQIVEIATASIPSDLADVRIERVNLKVAVLSLSSKSFRSSPGARNVTRNGQLPVPCLNARPAAVVLSKYYPGANWILNPSK
jgi:hypothetical protein